MSGFFAALYIIYLSASGSLPHLLPAWDHAVILSVLLFSGAGLLFACLKKQQERHVQNALDYMARLQQKDDIYRTLAEASQDVIARYDRNFRHTYVNPEIFKVTGKHPGEYLDKTAREMGLPEDLCAIWERSIAGVFATGKPDTLSYEIKGLDGTLKTIDWRAFPEFNQDGVVESVIRVSRDITERREYEKQQQKLQQLETLGIIAGGIAHDFNNILTVLFGNISLLKATLPDSHEGHEYIKNAEKAFDRAAHLSNQVLSLSKKGSPIKENLSLAKLIEEVTAFDLIGSNVKLVFEAGEELWPVAVDKGQMEQVFSNLATNANQAMPDGGHLYIDLENVDFRRRKTEEGLKQEKYIKIIVRDEGIGIDRQYLNHIFDPYFSTKDGGNGLGLATVYSIIIKHDGYISVKSSPGEGTVFSIYLPAQEIVRESVEKKQPVKPVATKQTGKILVMDDDSTICELAKRVLERGGFLVESAAEGREALEKYKRAMDKGKPFDCVIMDLVIPGGKGGKEAINDILEVDSLARAIVSSGYAVNPVMSNYDEYGFKGALEKPFTNSSLIESVQKALNS